MSGIVNKYSFSTNGFYRSDYHEEASIPDDAVIVSDEERCVLIAAQRVGKVIVRDGDGRPILSEPPGPTVGELVALERCWRDSVMLVAAGLRDRHRDQVELELSTTLLNEQYSELLGYIQALRTWPQSPDFPQVEHRPVAPPWLANSTQ